MSNFNTPRGEFVPKADLDAYNCANSAAAEAAWERDEAFAPLSYDEAKSHPAFIREKQLQALVARGVPEWRAIGMQA